MYFNLIGHYRGGLGALLIVAYFTLVSQVTRGASGNEPFYDEGGKLVADSSIASRLYPVERDARTEYGQVLSVSGCGDCLTAGVIYGIHRNLVESDCVSLALRAAALSLETFDAVPRTLEMLSVGRGKARSD